MTAERDQVQVAWRKALRAHSMADQDPELHVLPLSSLPAGVGPDGSFTFRCSECGWWTWLAPPESPKADFLLDLTQPVQQDRGPEEME